MADRCGEQSWAVVDHRIQSDYILATNGGHRLAPTRVDLAQCTPDISKICSTFGPLQSSARHPVERILKPTKIAQHDRMLNKPNQLISAIRIPNFAPRLMSSFFSSHAVPSFPTSFVRACQSRRCCYRRLFQSGQWTQALAISRIVWHPSSALGDRLPLVFVPLTLAVSAF